MDNRETYNGKTPFYMTYPMQNLYLAEMEYEKDMERMKEMYPKEINELQQMVERRADQMEYEGSRIYDENPDKEMLREEAERIYEEFLRWLEQQPWGQQQPPMPPMQPPPPPPPPPMRPMEPPRPPMDGARPWLLQQPTMPQQPMGEMPQDRRFMLNPPREWGEIMQESLGNLEASELVMEQQWGWDRDRDRDRNRDRDRDHDWDRDHNRDRRRCDNPWLCNLTEVLFHNEIYRRRCRHRRCRRWW